MYGYEPDSSLNPFLLLSEYTQEEIFEIGLGEYPSLTKEYLSPFREDNIPRCYFQWSGDKLFFVDFGDPRRRGHRDCFNFLMDMFEICSYADLASYIVNHFAKTGVRERKKISTKGGVTKDRSQYIVKKREYNGKDSLYWNQFEITTEQLLEDKVFGVQSYRVYSGKNQQWYSVLPSTLTYVIEGFEGDRCKIYAPYEKNKKRKWSTNCTADDIGGIETMDLLSEILIITKSYKDWRVLKNLGYNAVWFQNEGMFPSTKIMNRLLAFPTIYIFFDNDESGIKASQELYNVLTSKRDKNSVKQITSPYFYLKDPADIISTKGKQALNEFLWKNCQK